MAVFQMPMDRVAAVRRTLRTATFLRRSQYTGQEDVYDWGGEWWAYEIEMGLTTRQDGRSLSAFFTTLGGARNTFLFPDPTARHLGEYFALGAPQVDGAGQAGNVLVTDGWTPHATLRAGMCVSFGTGATTRFHMLSQDETVDAAGRVSLPIVPALRAAPNDNLAVEYARPVVRLRLSSPVPTSIAPADRYTFSFTAEEAL